MPLPRELPRSKPTAAGYGASAAPSFSRGDRQGSEGRSVLANRYRVGQKLGSGSFGCAYLVFDLKSNSEKKVLKQIAVAELQPDETVDAVREARLLAKLDHPSIVKFHDSFMDKDFFCIITEYCEGGDLDAKICQWRESKRTFEETLILDWFIQLTTAIKYIHDRRILHRDLKTRNIFLKNNVIKLGDFGISRILKGTSDLATTFTGTPYYMSPEVLKHDGYNAKSDVWSLGVVLYELCTLQHAFQGQNLMAVMYRIVEGDQPRLPDHFNTQLRQLFLKMLDKDPNNRPNAVEILQEPFIQQRMENLRGKMSMRMVSSHKVAEETEAIARALSPVKKKNLVQNEAALTPKQRMDLRKKQKADQEAEDRRRIAARNFSEGQKRFNEHKKRHGRVVPPWVEEHPEVFNESEFSITQTDSSMYFDLHGDRAGDTVSSAMEVSANSSRQPSWGREEQTEDRESGVVQHPMAWGTPERKPGYSDGLHVVGSSKDCGVDANSGTVAESSMKLSAVSMDMSVDNVDSSVAVGGDGVASGLSPLHVQLLHRDHHPGPLHVQRDPSTDIPLDPDLAESHYLDVDDFEADESESESEDEYEAILGCIEDALDLPNQPIPAEPVNDTNHDDFSPFTPYAREKRIALLRLEGERIYGQESFQKIYEYLKKARYSKHTMDESAIMAGLKAIVANVRDCFLVDQLVFLEKQAEALQAAV